MANNERSGKNNNHANKSMTNELLTLDTGAWKTDEEIILDAGPSADPLPWQPRSRSPLLPV